MSPHCPRRGSLLRPLAKSCSLVTCLLLALAATATAAHPASNRARAAGPAVRELPICNLPEALREHNYKGGSCVHASTESAFNWLHEYPLAKWWRNTYSGGESYTGLVEKLNKNKIPFYSTYSGDVNVLEKATAERRMATIFYYPSHSIDFNGFQDGYAYLLDNNRTGEWIRVPKDTFIKNWKGYGGVAVVPLIGAPAPPLPWRPKK